MVVMNHHVFHLIPKELDLIVDRNLLKQILMLTMFHKQFSDLIDDSSDDDTAELARLELQKRLEEKIRSENILQGNPEKK
jgi:hypothetical protein